MWLFSVGCRRKHVLGMEHPKEGPGSPGNAVSPLKTLWKCLFQTFRSVLLGEQGKGVELSLLAPGGTIPGHEAVKELGLCLMDPLP